MTTLTEPPGSTRLQALARLAGAIAAGSGLDDVSKAVVDAVADSFGLNAVLNLYDEATDTYVVRATAGDAGAGGDPSRRSALESLMAPQFQVEPDTYFVPHDALPQVSDLAGEGDRFEWLGEGYWHPGDVCLVRMRTSRRRALGVLVADSPAPQPLPDATTFEQLRLFCVVASNALENLLLVREVRDLEMQHEMDQLRQALEEEVALRGSLLEIGMKLGSVGTDNSHDIFQLVAERLHGVVAISSLTIYVSDTGSRVTRPIFHSEDTPDRDAILSHAVPFGVGATGTAAATRTSVISNAGDPNRPAVEVPDTLPDDEHLLAVPVLVQEQVRAVLTLCRPPTQPPFTDDDARRAQLFAQHLAPVFLVSELAESRRLLADQVQQLRDLNRLKDEFVANVSHELRTPLTGIIGNVMTVAGLGDMLPSEERRELLMGAERQAKRLAELLENLLAESRLTGDRPSLVPARVDVRSFLEEVAETLRFRAPEREIVATTAGRPSIVTDRTLLYRVLFNLGDNAIKYSDGPVRLEARPQDTGVRIDVVDEGIGIAPEDIPRIFEQFQQLDGSSLRRVGGVGLGLHLCARAADALGGRITVASEVGKGSRFSLWLPPESPR